GSDVTIFACGHLVWNAVEAEALLSAKGISVELINLHTIKPLDVEAILASVEKTRCAVTCEEHQINGGLGDAVAQVISRFNPSPLEMVAVNDSFGESGTPTELLNKYGLGPENIVAAVEKVLRRKK
ncbi:MAG: transketolase family protein, partial [Cyclobacteriaceae bacterium]|nr:transketolase family protein [Cyclobacteriaceae bacterium]